jgi:hypothetical protein
LLPDRGHALARESGGTINTWRDVLLHHESLDIMTDQRAVILPVEDNFDDVKLTLHAFKIANLAKSVHVARDGAKAPHGGLGWPIAWPRRWPSVAPRRVLDRLIGRSCGRDKGRI